MTSPVASPGRAARKAVPRRTLGQWDSRHRGHDAFETAAAAQSDDLRSQRLAGLARSPWQHYRGAPEVMAADLASRPDTGLTVQLCGDAHPGNFGQWQLPGAGSVFDIVDVDETISGPFEWDLHRLTAGLPILAEVAGVKPATTRPRPTISATPPNCSRRSSTTTGRAYRPISACCWAASTSSTRSA